MRKLINHLYNTIIHSVNEDVTVKRYEDTKNTRVKFIELTKGTDVYNSKKYMAIATNSSFF